MLEEYFDVNPVGTHIANYLSRKHWKDSTADALNH